MVRQIGGIAIELLQVRPLDHQLKRLSKAAADRLGDNRDGKSTLNLFEKARSQPMWPRHNILYGALGVIGQTDKDKGLIALAGAALARCRDRERAIHFRHLVYNSLHLTHHAIRVLGRGTLGCQGKAEQAPFILLGQEILVQSGVKARCGDE